MTIVVRDWFYFWSNTCSVSIFFLFFPPFILFHCFLLPIIPHRHQSSYWAWCTFLPLKIKTTTILFLKIQWSPKMLPWLLSEFWHNFSPTTTPSITSRPVLWPCSPFGQWLWSRSLFPGVLGGCVGWTEIVNQNLTFARWSFLRAYAQWFFTFPLSSSLFLQFLIDFIQLVTRLIVSSLSLSSCSNHPVYFRHGAARSLHTPPPHTLSNS